MANFRAIGGSYIPMGIDNPDVLLPSNAIIEPTLSAGTNYTSNGYNTYYYKIGSKVVVSVSVTGLNPVQSNIIFTLPQGYRPKYTITTSACTTQVGVFGHVNTNTNGTVVAVPPSGYSGLFITYSFDAFQ